MRAYYADPRNQFWSVLARVGLTPRQLRPQDFKLLLEWGMGLTDLAKFFSGRDDRLLVADYDVEDFRRKIEIYEPWALAFNGKLGAKVILGRDVDYGLQAKRIAGAHVFILPSTSGTARRYWDESYWSALAKFLLRGGT